MNSRSESSSDTHPTGGDMPAEMTAFDALAKELIETMRSKLKALLLLKHFEGDDGQYGATISPKWVTNVQSTLGSKVRAADQSLRAIDSIHSVLIPSINMYIEDTISTSADLVKQLRKSYPANNDAENEVLATKVAELDEDMLEGLHRTLSDFKSTELTNEIQSRSRAAYKQESRYSSLFAAISALTVYDTEPYIILRIAANMDATMQSDPESTQELDTAPGERAIQEIKKLTEKNPGGPLSELTGAALRTEQNREILNSLCVENALKIPAPHIEKCNSVKLIQQSLLDVLDTGNDARSVQDLCAVMFPAITILIELGAFDEDNNAFRRLIAMRILKNCYVAQAPDIERVKFKMSLLEASTPVEPGTLFGSVTHYTTKV